ncbi:MAG TPA: hypothetical protein VF461_16450, partial [Gemmatimonadaceae bacterium]
MQLCTARPLAAMTFFVLATLAAAACGDGATTPPDSTSDPNRDRLEITLSYGASGSPTSIDLFEITKDGRLTTPLVSSDANDLLPQGSNDGKKLLFTRFSAGAVPVASLWVRSSELPGLRQIIVDPNPPANTFNHQMYGSWSPDGASIAFYRSIGSTGENGIAVMAADGSGVRWLVLGADAPSWSVNGRIAFGKDGFIWTINPDGSGLLRVTSANGDFFPKWSRDGSKLVFLHATPSIGTNHDKDFDVVTIRADGTDRRTLAIGAINENPSWSPDGAYVLFDRRDVSNPTQEKCALYKIAAGGGAPVNLTPDRGVGSCGGASWRP